MSKKNGFSAKWLESALEKNPQLSADYGNAKKIREEIETASVVPRSSVPSQDGYIRFTIPGAPMGKPRQTRSDKWKKRPAVMKYREWADKARASAPTLPSDPVEVNFVAYLPIPDSWSKKKKALHKGQLHREKPDLDNICKSIGDSLFEQDKGIALGRMEKRYDDGSGPRLEVEVR